jgi:ABC-type molybdate transport system substrate-binding protein
MRLRLAALLTVVALLAVAWSGSSSPSTSGAGPASAQPGAGARAVGAAQVELTIYGAASLRGALATVKTAHDAIVGFLPPS